MSDSSASSYVVIPKQHLAVHELEDDSHVLLDFPVTGATVHKEGAALVVTCSDGASIHLNNALSEVAPATIHLRDGSVLDGSRLAASLSGLDDRTSLEDFLSRTAGEDSAAATVAGEKDREESGEESARVADGRSNYGDEAALILSGRGHYRDGTGDLVESVDRLDCLGHHRWEGAAPMPYLREEGAFSSLSSSSQPVAPPTINVAYGVGAMYINSRTVMENDPDGIIMNIDLSDAPGLGQSMVMSIGGTAVMHDGVSPVTAADTYANWASWQFLFANGTTATGLKVITFDAAGNLQIALPVGVTAFSINVPLYDNGISDGLRTFTYTILSTGGYVLQSPVTDTIDIIDENALPHYKPNLPDPEPGQPLPPEYGSSPYARPIAVLEVNDPENGWGKKASIAENSTAQVAYRFTLVNQADGGPFTIVEPITVTIKISTGNGMVLDGVPGQDYALISAIESAFSSKAGFSNVSYNAATGCLTFTIDPGCTDPTVTFNGSPVPDVRVEGVENLRLDIVDIEGHEVLRGGGVSTAVQDIPSVSVGVNTENIFESPGRAGMANQAEFTFTLTSAAPGDFNLQLEWADNSPAENAGDYIYSIDGGATWSNPGDPLPTQIAVGKGATSVSIFVRAFDDAFSENPETLSVTIKPENRNADMPGDNYHVVTSPGTGAKPSLSDSATITVHDDTSAAYGKDGAYLDGPTVIVVPVNPVTGNMAETADGDYVTHYGFMENSHLVEYRVLLVGPDGKTPYSGNSETIRVTLNIAALGGSEVLLESAGHPMPGQTTADFCFYDLGNLTNVFFNSLTGELSFDVPANTTSVTLQGKIYADAAEENGEGVAITVADLKGNEAKAGPALITEFYDLPVPSIAAVVDNVSESDTRGLGYTITLSAPSSAPITVWVLLGKSGDKGNLGEDYDRSNFAPSDRVDGDSVWVTIPPGETSHTFYVNIIDDELTENNETVTATIVAPDGTFASSPTDKYRLSPNADEREATVRYPNLAHDWQRHGTRGSRRP